MMTEEERNKELVRIANEMTGALEEAKLMLKRIRKDVLKAVKIAEEHIDILRGRKPDELR